MSDPLPFRLECIGSDKLADDVDWWAIYGEAFPEEEREPPEVILDSVRARTCLAVRARLREQTVGMATVHLLNRPPTLFLVYLGVAAKFRGEGIGGPLFEEARQAGVDRLTAKWCMSAGMVWEVDRPDQASSPEERNRRQRRIVFFERHGGVLLPRPYLQPPLRAGAPVPMHLMYRPALPGVQGLPTEKAVDTLVRAMYFEKYGAANGIPPEVLEQLLET